jgi:hypothetical protein
MFKNNKSVIIAALLIAVTTAIIGVSAANTGGPPATSSTPAVGSSATTPPAPPADKAEWQAKRAQMEADRAKLDAAVESGSFDTFKEVASGLPMGQKLLEKVTADNFARFAEAHGYRKQAMNLMQKSRDIMTEIGFTGGHKGFGRGLGKGFGGKFMGRGHDENEADE